eukprot:4802207-Amphidinium_carterae.1
MLCSELALPNGITHPAKEHVLNEPADGLSMLGARVGNGWSSCAAVQTCARTTASFGPRGSLKRTLLSKGSAAVCFVTKLAQDGQRKISSMDAEKQRASDK